TVGGGVSMPQPIVPPSLDAAPAPPPTPGLAQAARAPSGDATSDPQRVVTPAPERRRALPDPRQAAPVAVSGGVPSGASVGGVESVRFSSGGLDLVPVIRDVPKMGA